MKDIARLPVWAQEHIRTLQRERDVAVRTLNEFEDRQTKSNVWIEDHVCLGEQSGPTEKRLYLQDYKVTFQLGRTEVVVMLRESEQCLEVCVSGSNLYFQPRASNVIRVFDPKVRQ